MANINLVTGYRGENHVSAVDTRNFNVGICGSDNSVFEINDEFDLEVVTANLVRLKSGDGVMQGCHFRLGAGEVADLSVENGVTGSNRYDLVCIRYSKDSVTNIEEVNAVVIKGEATTGTPEDPTYNTGDLQNGEVLVYDFPLWRVPIEGLSIGTPVKLFSTTPSDTKAFDVSIPLSGWTNSVPYQNAVTVSGVKATDDFEILGIVPTGTASTDATMNEDIGKITYGSTSANTITFVCCSDKPSANITAKVRRVRD